MILPLFPISLLGVDSGGACLLNGRLQDISALYTRSSSSLPQGGKRRVSAKEHGRLLLLRVQRTSSEHRRCRFPEDDVMRRKRRDGTQANPSWPTTKHTRDQAFWEERGQSLLPLTLRLTFEEAGEEHNSTLLRRVWLRMASESQQRPTIKKHTDNVSECSQRQSGEDNNCRLLEEACACKKSV